MLLRWMPWKFLIGRAARAYGMIDPVQVLARLRGFSQPSEVQEPIELLRAGVIFQARGLINARVIQYNLDWIWPYWVERQFRPEDPSFVPRSFSLGHVNLTQRSWTAAGHPDVPLYPLVDPRGLVTPLYDGWSLDFWMMDDNGDHILPSRLPQVAQTIELGPQYTVQTRSEYGQMVLISRVWLQFTNSPFLNIEVEGRAPNPGWLIISVRPYNPEGISFIEYLAFDDHQWVWRVNKKTLIAMDQAPDRIHFSDFRMGDVFHQVLRPSEGAPRSVHCPLGLANSAAVFRLDGRHRTVNLHIPLGKALRREFPRWQTRPASEKFDSESSGMAKAILPDAHLQFLFDNAIHTVMMLSAGDVYPGPYTYKRFWFRDGCLMLHALLCLGALQRVHRHLSIFVRRQNWDGYFQSQKGEWDSNGQVLWILDKYQCMSNRPIPASWIGPVLKAARWILRKRTDRSSGQRHAGLLPAGFSAEHLGPNDFYFWDDFWAIAGLKAAARLLADAISADLGAELSHAANLFEKNVFACIEAIDPRQHQGGIPASPYRRMDAGAIGSMVADYPLQITPAGDVRIMTTLEYLMRYHFIKGGFFQDMIHSGINAYLTLDLAQTLLRAGDQRYQDLIQAVANLASPTGNWPEAIHPFSGGGCMGDGQHGWAAAEWLMMIRNLFVREEAEGLIIGSGLLPSWVKDQNPIHIRFGPTWTSYGSLTVDLSGREGALVLQLEGKWRQNAPPVEVRVPFHEPQTHLVPPAAVRLIPQKPTQ